MEDYTGVVAVENDARILVISSHIILTHWQVFSKIKLLIDWYKIYTTNNSVLKVKESTHVKISKELKCLFISKLF